MSGGPSRLLALYHGLSEQLGPELADTLMAYLPSTPATDLATRSGLDRLDSRLGRLEHEISDLRSEVRHLSQRMDDTADRLSQRMDDTADRLSQRMDRQQYTMAAGFVALTTALIASGFLG